MTTHSIKLDLDKTLQLPPPTITARQGDTQCGITAMVTDHGAPATLTGYTAKFQAAKPDGTYAEQAAQISGSTVTVELDPQFLAAAGLIRTAYFRFFEGTAEKESTQNMCIRVIHDAEGEAPDLSTSYIPTVDQLVEDATEALNSANTALGNAEEALEDAEAATDSATDAAASANAAANAAQSAIDAMTGNVLRGTVGPSEVVSVDDAYPQVPLGVKVKGATRQNLWVNPTGTQHGVKIKENGDGSVTVSGTATAAGQIASGAVYTLRPGTTYTASGTGLFTVYELNESASIVATHTTVQTFTTSDQMKYCVFAFYFTQGSSNNGTYRIMLNEGSTAQPWCPPGLNSVGDDDNVKIVTAGKNLAPTLSVNNQSGYTATVNEDGSYQISGTSSYAYDTPLRSQRFFLVPGEKYYIGGSIQGSVGTLYAQISEDFYGSIYHYTSRSFTAKEGATYFLSVTTPEANNAINGALYIQLELGSTATAYEPPNVTTTPIDLDGHTLNSLPDGTCDELRIDGTGAVTLTKRVGDVSVPSGTALTYVNEPEHRFNATITSGAGTTDYENGYSDKLPVRRNLGASPMGVIHSINANVVSFFANKTIYSADTAKTAIQSVLPTRLLYALATPQTIPLTSVTLPSLPGPTANVWAVATDGHGNTFTLQPEIELEYARDVTLVIGSLEAKVAALELLHETE